MRRSVGPAERPSETPAPSVEVLQARLTNIVAEFKRLKPDSMTVLLKPDGRTELHLHLHLNGERVDIVARLQRGDPAVLSAHWSQLQHNLAAQGIRLSALQPMPTPPPAAPDWAGGFPQPQQERPPGERGHAEPGEPAESVSAPRTLKRRTTPRPGHRAWESWA